MLIYSILISLPVIEYIRQSKTNAEVEFIREKGLRRIRNDIEQIYTENDHVSKTITNIKTFVKELEDELDQIAADCVNFEENKQYYPEGDIVRILNSSSEVNKDL